MIENFVKRWEARKEILENFLRTSTKKYYSYEDLFKLLVIHVLSANEDEDGCYYDTPDPARIVKINHGHYQGTFLFIVACQDYQPSTYWVTKVYYGSCGGCDTLQHILDQGDWEAEKLNDQQVKDIMTLCLHMVQRMKEI